MIGQLRQQLLDSESKRTAVSKHHSQQCRSHQPATQLSPAVSPYTLTHTHSPVYCCLCGRVRKLHATCELSCPPSTQSTAEWSSCRPPHDVLSSALKSQLDAQRSASQSQQEQLCAVLSRVDSVLDRTASVLTSSQSQLQQADDAISRVRQQADQKRQAGKAKRKTAGGRRLNGRAEEESEESEEASEVATSMPRVEEEEQAEAEDVAVEDEGKQRKSRVNSRRQKMTDEADITQAHQQHTHNNVGEGLGAADCRTCQKSAVPSTHPYSGRQRKSFDECRQHYCRREKT